MLLPSFYSLPSEKTLKLFSIHIKIKIGKSCIILFTCFCSRQKVQVLLTDDVGALAAPLLLTLIFEELTSRAGSRQVSALSLYSAMGNNDSRFLNISNHPHDQLSSNNLRSQNSRTYRRAIQSVSDSLKRIKIVLLRQCAGSWKQEVSNPDSNNDSRL